MRHQPGNNDRNHDPREITVDLEVVLTKGHPSTRGSSDWQQDGRCGHFPRHDWQPCPFHQSKRVQLRQLKRLGPVPFDVNLSPVRYVPISKGAGNRYGLMLGGRRSDGPESSNWNHWAPTGPTPRELAAMSNFIPLIELTT